MRRKEFMNVNEERLKEIMAHETDADGCPKTHPDGIEKEEDRGKEGKGRSLYPYPMAGQKSRPFSTSPLSGQGPPLRKG